MNRQYIGARYVPTFADPIGWTGTRSYEALTMVTYNNDTYTSKKPVPVGIDISNTDYWVNTGMFNAQLADFNDKFSSDSYIALNGVNKNILDNPRFKINRRSQTEYTDDGYGMDRWYDIGSTTLTIYSDHVDLRGSMKQILSSTQKEIAGRPWTLSVMATVPAGSIFYYGAYRGDDSVVLGRAVGDGSMKIFTVSNTDTTKVFDNIVLLSSGFTTSVYAVKMEIGEKQSLGYLQDGSYLLYDDYDYTADLLECARYLFTINSTASTAIGIRCYDYDANSMYFYLPMPVRMVASPTVFGSLRIRPMGGGNQSDWSFIANVRPHGLQIIATKTAHGLTDGSFYCAGVAGFSAEL